MKYRFIAIEGNIGAGKTTLATLLARHFNATLLLEQFEENPFLSLFYEDKEKYALPVELSFITDRMEQLQKTFEHIAPNQIVIADYSIFKSALFARNNLNKEEFLLYQRIHNLINTTLPKPDLFLYLHTPIARLQKQIRQRGRPYEQSIPDNYLEEIQEAYIQYFQQGKGNVLIVDNQLADFKEPAFFEVLISYITSALPLPQTPVTFV